MRTASAVGFVICLVSSIVWAMVIDPKMWQYLLIAGVVICYISWTRRPEPSSMDDPAVQRRLEAIFYSTGLHQARINADHEDDTGENRIPDWVT